MKARQSLLRLVLHLAVCGRLRWLHALPPLGCIGGAS